MVQLLDKKEERSKETEERRIREERSCSLELFGLMAHTVPWLLGSRRIREETKQKEIRNRRWNKSGTAGNLEDGLSCWRKEQFEHDEPSFFYDPVLSISQKRNIFILSWNFLLHHFAISKAFDYFTDNASQSRSYREAFKPETQPHRDANLFRASYGFLATTQQAFYIDIPSNKLLKHSFHLSKGFSKFPVKSPSASSSGKFVTNGLSDAPQPVDNEIMVSPVDDDDFRRRCASDRYPECSLFEKQESSCGLVQHRTQSQAVSGEFQHTSFKASYPANL